MLELLGQLAVLLVLSNAYMTQQHTGGHIQPIGYPRGPWDPHANQSVKALIYNHPVQILKLDFPVEVFDCKAWGPSQL